MGPADCGMTPPSRNSLTSGCTFAELGDSAGSAPGQGGSERHALAQLTMLSEVERGLERLWAELR